MSTPQIEFVKGTRYGRLTLMEETRPLDREGKQRRVWHLVCDCGRLKLMQPQNALRGRGTGCTTTRKIGRTSLCAVLDAKELAAPQAPRKRKFVARLEPDREDLFMTDAKKRLVAPDRIAKIIARVPTSVFDLGRVL